MSSCKVAILLASLVTIGFESKAHDLQQILSHINKDFTSNEQASREIGELAEDLRSHGDRRGLFPAIYAITITAGEEALRRGEFQDPKWTRQLILNYANLYRRTILKELTGRRDEVPYSWQLAFEYAQKPDWSPEIDALYGINVHIARDLVEALFVTTTDFNNSKMRADYYHISDLLRDSMPKISALFNKYPRALRAPAFIEETVMVNWIANLRHRAWRKAKVGAQYSERKKIELIQQIDERAYWQASQYGLFLPFLGH